MDSNFNLVCIDAMENGEHGCKNNTSRYVRACCPTDICRGLRLLRNQIITDCEISATLMASLNQIKSNGKLK